MNKAPQLIRIFSILFLVIVCFSVTGEALALGGLDTTAKGAGYVEKDLLKIGGNAVNIILSFVGVLFLIMMIVGGFMWMTSSGNPGTPEKPGRTMKAQRLITAGVIGLVIVLSAYAITAWLGDTFKW